MRTPLAAGGILLLLGGALAMTDYVVKEQTVASPIVTDTATQGSSSSASSVSIIEKGTSTKKFRGADLTETVTALGLTIEHTSEPSLIELSAAGLAEAETFVLLKDNDRAFFFSVIESPLVKKILSSLKQALQDEFSADLKELRDETIVNPSGPTVEYLSFIDPAISEEPLLFMRVRDKLYELHIAENGQELLESLVNALQQ